MPIYPGDSNKRIGRENENDNPMRKGSSIITLIVIQGSDMYLEKLELEQPCKKAVLRLLLFSREIQE